VRFCTSSRTRPCKNRGLQASHNAPVGEPILLLVQGHDAPVVAIQDEDGDWQVTWNGDVITEAISNSLHRSRPNRPIHFSCAS
jgi:hypothetical protein